MQAKRASLKHALLIRQQKTARMGNFQLVWQTTFTNYCTAHTSQRTRVTHEKRCGGGTTNIVRPFLLNPTTVLGIQQAYIVLFTLCKHNKLIKDAALEVLSL